MKKIVTVFAATLLMGALLTGCNNGNVDESKDGTISSPNSVPSPSEMISNIPSAVESVVSDVESGLENMGSAMTPSSSHPY